MVNYLRMFVQLYNLVVTVRHNTTSLENIEQSDPYHGMDVNIAIASTISAGARVYMSYVKNSKKPYNLYYSDTDSIVIDGQLDDEIVSDTVLGQFKLEHTILRAVFLAPKVYAFIDLKGNEVVKVKGLGKIALQNTHIKDLEALLQKDTTKYYSQTKWFKKLYEGTITISDILYQLKVTNNKRAPIYHPEYEIFTNTRPYNYDEFEN